MDTQDIIKKVRTIEIKTRKLSANIFAGQYHSAFKGRGMAFSKVREYQFGDDVGTHRQMKSEMVAEIAATLAFSAIQNNDKIGVVFFSDKIEKYIPPKKGRKHILYIIRELLDFHAESRRTDLNEPLEFLSNVMKRRCTVFMLSDFYTRTDFLSPLTICSRKHDVVAVQVYDKCAAELPDVGLMKVVDAETGHEQYIDTSSRKIRQAHRDYWIKRQTALQDVFNKNNVDSISIATDEDYVKSLLILFKQRS